MVKCFTKPGRACLGTVQGMATHPTPPAIQPKATGLQDWIEVFRSGTHTDSQGRSCSFTNADLDQMVANLATLGAAPLVIGHPKHDDPACGWVRAEGARRDGNSLFIKAADVNPVFAAGVDSGAYRNRSLKVAKHPVHGWRMQHVGWLGAALPALDGLQPLNYSADEGAESHEFAAEYDIASSLEDLAVMLRGLRESVIAKDGIEAADLVLPDWRIAAVMASAGRVREAGRDGASTQPMFNQQIPPTGAPMSLTQADLDRTAAETEARVRAELGSQFSASSAELAQLKADRQRERIATQISGWKQAGLLLPAEEAGLAEFMAVLDGGEPGASFEFTAADGKAQSKKTCAEYFAEFVAARGKLVKLTGAGGKVDGDSDPAPAVDTGSYQAIVKAANEFIASEAKAGREIAIDTAVAHVTRNV